jgi:hypothetical protein
MNYIKIPMEQIGIILSALSCKDNEGLLEDKDCDFIYDLYCELQGTKFEKEIYIEYGCILDERINAKDVIQIKKCHLEDFGKFRAWIKRSYEDVLKNKPAWEYFTTGKGLSKETIKSLIELQSSLYNEIKELNDMQFDGIKLLIINKITDFINVNYMSLTEEQIKVINEHMSNLYAITLAHSTKETMKENLITIINEGVENFNVNMLVSEIVNKLGICDNLFNKEQIYNIVIESIKNKVEEINQEV